MNGRVWFSAPWLLSLCFILPLLSCFPHPLCSCNILLSRCQLPPLSASVFICASVFFLRFLPFVYSIVCVFLFVFYFFSFLVSAPHVLSTPFKVHKQPQFGHLISTPSNYYLSCNNLGLFTSSFYPTPPLETGAYFSPYNVMPPPRLGEVRSAQRPRAPSQQSLVRSFGYEPRREKELPRIELAGKYGGC